MTATAPLPRWDMTPYFPGIDTPEFTTAMGEVQRHIADLQAQFDRDQIDQRPDATLDDATVEAFERTLAAFNTLIDEAMFVGSYVAAFITTDSRDTVAQSRMSELQQQQSLLSQLQTRLTAWLGSLDVEALIVRSSVADDHAFALRKASERAKHLMSPIEEALAAEMRLTGSVGWELLYENTVSQHTTPVEVEGKWQDLPMSAIRNMAYSPDRSVRQRAYHAELAGWKAVAPTLASTLNGIKGEVNTLSRRRHWETPLDQAIFEASIDRQTFEAMMGEARAAFPEFRRYLRVKARALGIEKLAWYDIFAPVGSPGREWSYAESTRFVVEQFGRYSPRLSDFAARAFRENWIDAEARPGKRGGAFCMSTRGDESRVLTNFEPTYNAMSTLAHELGHGYHNLNLYGRTATQRDTPMTLAETASTFCETLIRFSAMEGASPSEQMAILEASLQDSCQIVVDITSRFTFEQEVFNRRRQHDLSVEELCTIMRESQLATYGDGLDEAELHPYMWAAKGHYYSGEVSYYNFPYMFGLLFGLGLYARYQQDPEAFKEGYDALLSSTGLADAATLAARFGIDTRTPEFWRGSLDVIRGDIDRFEAIVTNGTA